MKLYSSKTKKILVFAKHLDGGTGMFVKQLISLGQTSEKETMVVVLALEKPQFRAFMPSFAAVSYFSNNPLLPYSYILTPTAVINTFHELVWLKSNVSRYQPDIIISVDNHCNVLACLCRLLFYRTRLILTIHNNISAVTFAKLPSFGRTLFKHVSRFLFRQAYETVCVSQGVALDAKQFFSLPTLPKVIHVGVNIQAIQRLADKKIPQQFKEICSPDKIKIITVGRFAPQKDFKTLIEAFALFHKSVKSSLLVIIGDGQDKKKIIKDITAHKLDKYTYLLGWKQNVYPYLRAADVFVLSSNYEGFPYVLLEAAALGKPVVATDAPFGPRELLGDNMCGLVVPMKNSEAMARALQLLSHRRARSHYQIKIIRRVKMFTEAIMLQRYQSLIDTTA